MATDTAAEMVPPSPASMKSSKEFNESASLATLDEQRLFYKLDWRILPIITLLFLLAFLDRTNIGSAKVAGIVVDLKLVGLQYNTAAAIFFVSYIIFEIPSNLAMKRFKPANWIALIMTLWGVVMISMAFVKSYAGLLAARFFLGTFEAGLFPAATFYLSQWYPRRILAQRMAIFVSAATLAGAFGGILAFAIQHMNGLRGLHGWSWIFLLEGVLTVICALAGLVLLPDYPEKAALLSPHERGWLLEQLRADAAGAPKDFQWNYVLRALKDYKSYIYVLLFFCSVTPGYCFSLFIPVIIQGLGFESIKAQAMSTPPFVLACILTYVVSIACDKYRTRGPYICFINLLGIVGFSILYATTSPAAGYVGSFLACCGIFPNTALIISWAGANTQGDLKRAVVLAMASGLGNFGGFPASFVFRQQDAPRYHPGYATCIGCLCFSFLLSAGASWNFRRLNLLNEKRIKAGADRAMIYMYMT